MSVKDHSPYVMVMLDTRGLHYDFEAGVIAIADTSWDAAIGLLTDVGGWTFDENAGCLVKDDGDTVVNITRAEPR